MPEKPTIGIENSRGEITAKGDVVGHDKISGDQVLGNKIVVQYPRTPEKKHHTLSPKALRNRSSVLWQVRDDWIKNVLERSLYQAILIDLGKTVNLAAVKSPWNTVIRQPERDDQLLPSAMKIVDIFKSLGGKLLILGEPGSGKTTTLLNLARTLLDIAEEDSGQLIPVVFNLSSWAEKRMPLTEWLADELNAKYYVPSKVAWGWVYGEQILPLLDGLDEVDRGHQAACIEAINQFRHDHGAVPIAVCSRIGDYEVLSQKLELQGAVILKPLTLEQVESYLRSLGDEVEGLRLAILRDAGLQELVTVPLLLNVAILAFRGSAPRDLAVGRLEPEQLRKQLFDSYIKQAFKRRASARASYPAEEAIRWLTWLATKMVEYRQSVFFIEGLQPRWLPRDKARKLFGVIFALVTTLVYGLTLGMFSMLTVGLLTGLGTQLTTLANLEGVLIGGILLSALSIGLFSRKAAEAWEVLQIRHAENFTIDLTHVRIKYRAELVRRMRPWLVGAFLGALVSTLVFGSGSWLLSILLCYLLAVLVIGLVEVLSVEIKTSESVKSRVSPNEGTRRSARNALRAGLGAGLIATPLGFLLGGIEQGFCHNFICGLDYFHWTLGWPNLGIAIFVGASAALTVGLSYGGRQVILHSTLRFLLWRGGNIPFNYNAFLNYCTSLNILRKVGGSYMFIHRSLLEHFANAKFDGELTNIYAILYTLKESIEDLELPNKYDSQEVRAITSRIMNMLEGVEYGDLTNVYDSPENRAIISRLLNALKESQAKKK